MSGPPADEPGDRDDQRKVQTFIEHHGPGRHIPIWKMEFREDWIQDGSSCPEQHDHEREPPAGTQFPVADEDAAC